MSHVFKVSDDQYKSVEEVARERGQLPEEFFHRGLRLCVATLVRRTNPDQAWFWTPGWQAKEREADAAIVAKARRIPISTNSATQRQWS